MKVKKWWNFTYTPHVLLPLPQHLLPLVYFTLVSELQARHVEILKQYHEASVHTRQVLKGDIGNNTCLCI
jgi:hypothetical protein